jgi:CBS domain-containing protein
LNDVIRVHALGVGSRAQNGFERLDDVSRAGALPAGQTDKLSHALEFLSMVRMRHQAQEIKNDHEPHNAIQPEHLSDSERYNLKEAFQILSNAQKFLRFRYPSPGR